MTNNLTVCAFCDSEVEKIQEIAHLDSIRFIYPWSPVIPQHIMLVTARHTAHPDDLTLEEAGDVMRAYGALKYAFRDLYGYTGGNMFVNDGPEAGQHVPHVHFHVFGRSESEPVNPYKPLNNLKEHPAQKLTADEIRQRADGLKTALTKYL